MQQSLNFIIHSVLYLTGLCSQLSFFQCNIIDMLQTMSTCLSSTKLFVVLPPATANDYAIFGGNSVRPMHEVQDVVHLPASKSNTSSMIKVCFMSSC